MKLRWFAAVVMVGGLGLLAGCPFGFDLGFGLGGGAIPDGTYTGDVSAVTNFWEGETLSDQDEYEGETFGTFQGGVLLDDAGDSYEVGGVDFLEDGAYEIMREVNYVDFGPWGYEIGFDLTAEWNSIPMTGWEIATYSLNADGTLDLFDEIELTSEDWYDGGWWTIHSDAYATLLPGQAPAPGPGRPGRDLLDLKSGKIRR